MTSVSTQKIGVVKNAQNEWQVFYSNVEKLSMFLISVAYALMFRYIFLRHRDFPSSAASFTWVSWLGCGVLWGYNAFLVVNKYQGWSHYEPPSENSALKRWCLYQIGRLCFASAAIGIYSVSLLMMYFGAVEAQKK